LARALIVGCGCRGRALGAGLAEAGWQVRGTARTEDGAARIRAAGVEAAVADPGAIGTLLDHLDGVALVYWLLGSAEGDPALVDRIHGEGLEHLLARLVDTPVRGFVYEAAGEVSAPTLRRGAQAVQAAAERWRIPVEVVEAPPSRHQDWMDEMLAAARRLTGL
jgi:nucleoside-diphosphate-sugar epimerase